MKESAGRARWQLSLCVKDLMNRKVQQKRMGAIRALKTRVHMHDRVHVQEVIFLNACKQNAGTASFVIITLSAIMRHADYSM